MVIFHSYVSLPEGNLKIWNNPLNGRWSEPYPFAANKPYRACWRVNFQIFPWSPSMVWSWQVAFDAPSWLKLCFNWHVIGLKGFHCWSVSPSLAVPGGLRSSDHPIFRQFIDYYIDILCILGRLSDKNKYLVGGLEHFSIIILGIIIPSD